MLKKCAIVAFAAAMSMPAVAQQRGQNPAQQQPTITRGGEQPGPGRETAGPAEEKISQTPHVARIDGRDIKYTATIGTLPIMADDGKVAARMFFVAYTKDGEDPKGRPVSFLYNGGPGSATIWLHMGSFGPKRVQMADEGFQPAPPYRLVGNDNSLLDTTDLVFVDAISTGYSRVVAGVNPAQYHGQSGDLRAFGDFINQYLGTYARWASPRYSLARAMEPSARRGCRRNCRHGTASS